jgi:hypothetical protein
VRRRALAPLALLVACDLSIPGEVVGTYKVKVALRDNGCGPGAVYTNDGRSYSVELREDAEKGRGYWHVPKQRPLTGTIEGDTFMFAYDSVVVSTPGDAGVPGCTLTQAEVLAGSFVRADAGSDGGSEPSADEDSDGGTGDAGGADAGSADAGSGAALTATHTLTISVGAGSSCASALAPRGPFTALPCTIVYDLEGSARSPL